jgi:hypothetical protein
LVIALVVSESGIQVPSLLDVFLNSLEAIVALVVVVIFIIIPVVVIIILIDRTSEMDIDSCDLVRRCQCTICHGSSRV